MTVLFNPIPQNVTVLTAIASGNVLRATYTVPAGKRAILTHASITIFVTAAAANTTIGIITATINGTAVTVLRVGNAAVITGELNVSMQPFIDLTAADTVTINTINNSAVAVTMALHAVIREYT